MYRCPLPRLGGYFQIGHKAFHNGKTHTASVGTAGGVHWAHGLLNIRDTDTPVFDYNIQNLAFQYATSQGYSPQFIGISMDNAVRNCFGYGSSDISQ